MKKYLVALVTVLLVGPGAAMAQTSIKNLDVTVSPVFFDLVTEPGNTISERVRLYNNSSEAIPAKITVSKLGVGKSSREAAIMDFGQGDDFGSWVHVDKTNLTLPAHEWVEVPFSIDVNKAAAFGYYWALVVSRDEGIKQAPSSLKIEAGIAVPVLLNVKRVGARASGSLVSFETSRVNEYLPVKFAATVANSGNVHIKPRGNVFIQDGRGKDIAIVEINPEKGSVLPNTQRTFQAAWEDGFLVRDDSGKVTVHWNKVTSMRFGKYTAKLLMVFDDGMRDVPLESSAEFWVVPYTALGLAGGGVILVVMLLKMLLDRYVKSQLKRYSVGR